MLSAGLYVEVTDLAPVNRTTFASVPLRHWKAASGGTV